MRYNNDGMSRVLSKLNEAQEVPFVEPESTIGVDPSKDVRQCPACSGFYLGTPGACPVCGATIVNESRKSSKKRRKLHESDEEDTQIIVDEEGDVIDTVEEGEELPKDVKVEINEGMRMLSRGEYKKFNENFKNSKLLKNGKLNFLVESTRTGRMYSVVRKLNAVQKANYKLSESLNMKTSRRTVTSAKLSASRTARTSLAALTEMNAIRVAAMRLLERQGVHYDHRRFNESMKQVVLGSTERFRKKFESIESDKETGAVDFTECTPEEISSDVTQVVEDAGLEVVTQEVDASNDTAAVQIRVQDDPTLEVNLQDIADAAAEVMDAPVAVVGPSVPEGDSTLADITVLVNPDDEIVEEGDKVALSESLRARISARKLNESRISKRRKLHESEDCEEEEDILEEEEENLDDLPKLSERRSLRRRSKKASRKRNESCEDENKEASIVKIKEADEDEDETDLPLEEDEENNTEDEETEAIVIEEEEDDSDETLDLIDQAKKLDEKIRASRRRNKR